MQNQCKTLRYLRLKHKISTREMGAAMGISHSRYSEIELEECNNTAYLQALLETGIGKVIKNRKENIAGLEADFYKYKGSLLEQREDFI